MVKTLFLSLIFLPPNTCADPGAVPIRFKTKDGWAIAALYRKPDAGKNVALLVHGVGAGKGEWEPFCRELWKLGLGTLTMDMRGHGESQEGPSGPRDFRTFESQDWAQARLDIEAAAVFLSHAGIASSRLGLIGGSIGANLASQAARTIKPGWLILLSPGLNYRDVAPRPVLGLPTMLAASPEDPYSYQSVKHLIPRWRGAIQASAKSGHGAQMLSDENFLKALLRWISSRQASSPPDK